MLNLFKYRFFWEGLIIASLVVSVYLKNEWKSSTDSKATVNVIGVGFVIIAIIAVFIS